MGKTTVRGASRPSMKVEAWPLDRIKPYAGNPRKISETAVDKVAASLKKYGWRQPIVVCAAGEIVAGHTRKRAAELILERGESIPNWPDPAKAPVHPSGMDETEARAYRLADNRAGEEASWDLRLLEFEFELLAEVEFDFEDTLFDAAELIDLGVVEATFEPGAETDQGALDQLNPNLKCPACGHEWTQS